MNILLIGSGGREHALAYALAKSPLCTRLFTAPGNPGTAQHGENRPDLPVADHAAVRAFCEREGIGLVVVGPEAPLVAGLVDDLTAAGIRAFGPTRAAAQLEGSKGFTKDLCARYGIPTAAYARFSALDPALAYLRETGAPIVVKADGLAAGKGVTVADTLEQAEAALRALLSEPGAEVVIEECLVGEEASFFALCDGTRAIPVGTAQDHKRVFDGDRGPNTGGMGAYSPASIVTPELERTVMETIIAPTLRGMRERGTPFTGILYAGLMLTEAGPKLIEYNTRFGDPEAQVLMPRLASDLVPALLSACDGDLAGVALEFDPHRAALTVVMAAAGYPGTVVRGSEIRGVAEAAASVDTHVFQAGTRAEGDRLLADGGRVLAVTALGDSVMDAQARAYAAVARIDWPEGFCRRDIGRRAVAREVAGEGI
ncbi:phosphoribosylamine--glycine ligase [Methylobacterium oxalidis]|uniref:Phosphoribosylamine--glycine ligase n=1 Tax=Methylobacterium oxalidis TaxID=944322 RepID=A0A512J8D8_9HYPH|nr:phosphoribosylamine--glycine ligase [Methylobacterium oxalidis]GEP06220.1 phosphoribosylamine--glycine ligase [Methylobacterium oxalidis]GJE32890.1 Phosphoribosylamine--glycine ligase [Methylobacterium oxalidis]GLS63000.1 phosphoribosylamine--glycine ligase [Methylobacterium oxalidis]